jgi:hypothetical protein
VASVIRRLRYARRVGRLYARHALRITAAWIVYQLLFDA